MSAAGTVIKLEYSDFKNKKILGEGSFNQVYYAEHPKLGPCVVKIVTRAFFAKPKQKKKLEEEAVHMFSIQHDNLIKGYGIVMEPNHLCLVYEYAKYGCLADVLRRIPNYFTWALKVRTAFQTACAINFLHNHAEHLIHRNLKSTNILFDDKINIKVSDFITPKSTVWMSQATQQKEITERKKIAEGTPPVRKGRSLAHIPPEIVQNINTQAVESYDMYSYGVVLWELLTNKRPFDGATTEEVYRKMSEGFAHPFDVVLSDRPQYLFNIMKEALNIKVMERPKFQSVFETLKPANDEQAAAACADAKKCKDAYDEYKATRREKITSRQVSSDTGATTPSTPQTPHMEPVFEDSSMSNNRRVFNEPDYSSGKGAQPYGNEDTSGQMVSTSAHVTPTVYSSDQSRRNPAASKPTLKRTSQPTDAEEKMDVEPPREDEVSRSVSYSEQGSDPNKAIPFMDDDPSPPSSAPPTVRVAGSQQAVYNIQAEHINLHVGDNMAPSAGGGDAPPPPRPDANMVIPASGSQRPLTRRDKYRVVENVGPQKWRHMARHMNLSDSVIDSIDYDFNKEGLREKIYQVIHRWSQKFRGQVTVGELVEVLKEANMHDIASLLDP